MDMDIKKIMVLGAGQMGGGIAQVCAQTGYQVILRDIKEEFVQNGLKVIEKNLQRGVEKGRMTSEEKDAVMGRITPTLTLDAGADADIVIEAIIEDAAMKRDTFMQLDTICPPHTILASNTSSVPITEIAAATKRPEKVIGMHFMNPVPVMKLVEVIRGIATSDETYHIIDDLSKKLDKVPVEVNDYPGFVSNRVLMPMINEAVYCLMEGVGSVEAGYEPSHGPPGFGRLNRP
jgi:3-hydroxybutyryl-CoA dehydrogenase